MQVRVVRHQQRLTAAAPHRPRRAVGPVRHRVRRRRHRRCDARHRPSPAPLARQQLHHARAAHHLVQPGVAVAPPHGREHRADPEQPQQFGREAQHGTGRQLETSTREHREQQHGPGGDQQVARGAPRHAAQRRRQAVRARHAQSQQPLPHAAAPVTLGQGEIDELQPHHDARHRLALDPARELQRAQRHAQRHEQQQIDQNGAEAPRQPRGGEPARGQRQQRRPQLRVALEALLLRLGEQPQDHTLQSHRHRRGVLGERHRLARQHLRQHRRRVGAGVGQLAGDHLVQHRADAVEIAAQVERLGGDLLGTGVVGRAEERAGLAQVAVHLEALRDAEVADLGAAGGVEEHVRRLDVAVQDPRLLGALEPLQHVQHDVHRRAGLERAVRDPVGERAARHQLHGDVGEAVVRAGVEHVHAVGIGQGRGDAPFLLEALQRPRRLGAQLREHLQGDVAVVDLARRLPHLGEPAFAERADEAVGAEGGAGGELGHAGGRSLRLFHQLEIERIHRGPQRGVLGAQHLQPLEIGGFFGQADGAVRAVGP